MTVTSNSESTAALPELEAINLAAVTAVLQYWNAQDIDGMLAFYHDDITWTNVALEKTYRGKDEVRAFLRELFTGLPDLTFDVTYKFARGNQVAERWTISGTHRGNLMGVPATGRPLEIPGIGMVVMRDGKFVSDWFLLDLASIMRQLGIMPPLSVTETTVGRAALWAVVHRRAVGLSLGALASLAVLKRKLGTHGRSHGN